MWIRSEPTLSARSTLNEFVCRGDGRDVAVMTQSEILGGRGEAWAAVRPVELGLRQEQFDEQFPVGRGVIASLATDPDWKSRQFEAAGDVALDRAWLPRRCDVVLGCDPDPSALIWGPSSAKSFAGDSLHVTSGSELA